MHDSLQLTSLEPRGREALVIEAQRPARCPTTQSLQTKPLIPTLPSLIEVAEQVKSKVSTIQATHDWSGQKTLSRKGAAIFQGEYMNMRAGGEGACNWLMHFIRAQAHKKSLIQTIQAAEMVRETVFTKGTFSGALQQLMPLLETLHPEFTSWAAQSKLVTSTDMEVAVFELVRVLCVYVVLAFQPNPTAWYNDKQMEKKVDIAKEWLSDPRDGLFSLGMKWLDNNLADVKLNANEQAFTSASLPVLIHCFINGFDHTKKLYIQNEERVLGSYITFLTSLIAELKNELDLTTTLQTKVMAGIATATFTVLTWGFDILQSRLA